MLPSHRLLPFPILRLWLFFLYFNSEIVGVYFSKQSVEVFWQSSIMLYNHTHYEKKLSEANLPFFELFTTANLYFPSTGILRNSSLRFPASFDSLARALSCWHGRWRRIIYKKNASFSCLNDYDSHLKNKEFHLVISLCVFSFVSFFCFFVVCFRLFYLRVVVLLIWKLLDLFYHILFP